jgi:hypothetical protein
MTSLHIRRTTGNADTSQNGKITRQLVLTAALEIIDSDAADALSMRRRDASPRPVHPVLLTANLPFIPFARSRGPVTGTSGTVALVDRGWLETGPVTTRRTTTSVFAGFRFPPG